MEILFWDRKQIALKFPYPARTNIEKTNFFLDLWVVITRIKL
jgi:hypothetical protein